MKNTKQLFFVESVVLYELFSTSVHIFYSSCRYEWLIQKKWRKAKQKISKSKEYRKKSH